MKPLMTAAATETADDDLVLAVREGSEEAFEALYRRYRQRIVGYVRGICGDHARAEDIAQEAFVSALRGLRSSEKEIVFRPWLYEIAKNACIDHMRRSGRRAEVSIDSDDFSPQEEGRISQSVSGTDAEVARRKELESLRMAFGDLPEAQHQILIMREFEGLSYDRIGSRMGLSRGAVESMLFRARRTLRDGFDEIDTGVRCERMHVAMEAVANGRRNGIRERRRLEKHLRECPDCRRNAVTIGLDELALAAARDRGSRLRRLAGLLPLPAFLRRRIEDGAGLLSSMGPAAEHGASLATKATAVVAAAAVAVGGAGVATKASGGAVGLPSVPGISSGKDAAAGKAGGGESAGRGATSGRDRSAAGAVGGTSQTSGGRGGQAGSPAGPGAPSGGRGGDSAAGRDDPVRSTTGALGQAVNGTVGSVGGGGGSQGGTVDRVGGTVNGLAGQTVDGVNDTLQGVTGGKAPRLPKPQLPLPGSGSSGTGGGGGGGGTTLPDVGGTVNDTTSQLPVPLPKVQLPKTDVTLPGNKLLP